MATDEIRGMATDEVTTPAQKVTRARRIRQIGERFTDLERGELLVVDRNGCDGCVYLSRRNDHSHSACNTPEQLELTSSCVPHEKHDGTSAQFVRLDDYAVFKLTGEWP